MHPAPSVIVFTTLSGLGFGLLTFLGLGLPAVTGWVAFVFYLVAYLFAVGGLVASTFHLGNPKNAPKAFTQWRTSWLSREAICAVAALVLMGLFALGAVFFGGGWQPLGYIGALMSLATVFTTSMIYAQLKTVPRWNHWLTSALFLSLALGGGALLAGQVWAAMVLLVLAGGMQLAAWAGGDKRFRQRGHTLETATMLPGGTVRQFEPPHTGSNYLLDEMVYVVGRKHARKLRIIAMLLMVVVPVLVLFFTVDASAALTHLAVLVAVLSHLVGVACARWLFFAEAEHVVGLYYGKR
ncbi:dimethyl sulfoxide reductase anchor subunit family protein [Pseudaestuariivita atlantica]|uniref:Dibenzothiophene desulfurase n=1 Tax=Pseudaestuariivita atlantica TaxID=1317121 RepID=A0A0L1JQ59_9RHOB|nr:DmsC/YnfH family molybdoenzyme membrane anchor subunit [Pseudaestuariivita atlantica]KNG93857.1 dibenzothiophene desulfurase [Pseudaestuariivita atlantica]